MCSTGLKQTATTDPGVEQESYDVFPPPGTVLSRLIRGTTNYRPCPSREAEVASVTSSIYCSNARPSKSARSSSSQVSAKRDKVLTIAELLANRRRKWGI